VTYGEAGVLITPRLKKQIKRAVDCHWDCSGDYLMWKYSHEQMIDINQDLGPS
jgi:hypothetical protein